MVGAPNHLISICVSYPYHYHSSFTLRGGGKGSAQARPSVAVAAQALVLGSMTSRMVWNKYESDMSQACTYCHVYFRHLHIAFVCFGMLRAICMLCLFVFVCRNASSHVHVVFVLFGMLRTICILVGGFSECCRSCFD